MPDGVLVGRTILVPAASSLELANAALAGERRKSLHQREIDTFTALLENLAMVRDIRSVHEGIGGSLPVARAHGLTAYDAAYLEL